MRLTLLHWLLTLICLHWLQFAQAGGLAGSPPYVRHVPDLDVYPQNFAIAQDSRGIVYVGNANGVLEFDGERWNLIALDNRDMVRSLAVGADDRVYVGGYNSFGYLQRDAAGSAQYVDLLPRFGDALAKVGEVADIWDILVAPEGIYFRGLRDVFFWDPIADRVLSWHFDGRFGALEHVDGQTLLQFRGVGFKRREGADWVLLDGSRELLTPVFQLVPLADGGRLMMGVDKQWRRYRNGQVEPIQMPAQLPAPSNFNTAIDLRDGSLVFPSRDGVIYIVDPTRRSERHFKLDSGFLSSAFASADGGFLVSGNLAVYKVAWPTAWSVLAAEHGIDGTLLRLSQWNGSDYLLSSAGAFRLLLSETDAPRFERLPWGDTTVYDLIGIDARRALLATPHKLMQMDHGVLRELSPEVVYPRLFQRSLFNPRRIYIGTENGLRFLDLKADTEILSERSQLGADTLVTSLVETSVAELWFGTERHGVWRVRMSPEHAVLQQRRFGPTEGLELGVVAEAQVSLLADGSLIAATARGFFRLDGERFVADPLFGLEQSRLPEELLNIAQAPDGRLWAYSIGRVFQRSAAGEWREQAVRQLRRGAYLAHSFGAQGRVALIASQSMLLYDGADPPAHPLRAAQPGVQLREVTRILADGEREGLPLLADEPIVLDQGDFGIQFRFALADLAHEHGRVYQGRLLGYEAEFSQWSDSHAYTYSRLSPGAYTLQVRARDGNGRESEIRPYALLIVPPWYRSSWAWALWLLLGAAILGWAVRHMIARRTARLDEDKTRLEATVAERTRDLAAANLQLEQMANLDGLTGIANRRRLDQYLPAIWAQALDRQRSVAVLAIDVDHFKRYNDSHGHLAGDQFLKDLVPRLSQSLRRSEDLLARYGGEEFLVVLPGADLATATQIAENMRQTVESAQLGTTISIGVASRIPASNDVTALIQAADTALYGAKAAGRNRVELGR